MKRQLLGFLLAPVPAALFQAAVVGVWPKIGTGVFEHPPSMFVAVCLYFYVAQLLLGVPLYLWFRKRRQQHSSVYGLIGAIIILSPVALAVSLSAARRGFDTYSILYNFAFFGVGGFFAGLVFWRAVKVDRNAHRA